MLRVPLDNLLLQIVSMNVSESCRQILSQCPDPPDLIATDAAVKSLYCLQALKDKDKDDTKDGKSRNKNDDNFTLTPLGKNLAALPCSPKIGRLLIYGSLLACTLPCSAIAASANSKSPFLGSSDPEIRSKVDEAKRRYCKSIGTNSDQLAISEACREFMSLQISKAGQSELRKHCFLNGLSYDTIIEIITLQKDLLQNLASLGFIPSVQDGLDESSTCNRNCRKSKVLSAAICAGFYPQLARVLKPPKKYVETMGSAFAKETEAHELKLYIPEKPDDGFDMSKCTDDNVDKRGLQKVWIHPSSINSNETSFANRFLVYTDRQVTSKAYMRDVTEVTAYPILFFGGSLNTNFSTGLITIDGWLRFSGPGRVVALIQGLRGALDELLELKIVDPTVDVYSNPALIATVKLISSDGIA
jgi:ATP-dependent RNA helicase DHX57